jgi:hypothetical protein
MDLSFGINVEDIDAFMRGERIKAYVGEYEDPKLPMTADLKEVEISGPENRHESENSIFHIKKRNGAN